MAQILSIDTSTKVCSVALHSEGELIASQSYHLQKSHSSLLPSIINELLDNCEASLKSLEAIAISAGPGSYTGLRIGTATAKGLAYSLSVPLIALDSLDSMVEQVNGVQQDTLLCPMIDARRMEVYCKLVKKNGEVVWPTKPVVVDKDTFSEFADENIVLFGNGAQKLKEHFEDEHIGFVDDIHPMASHMGKKAYQCFTKQQFVDLAYFEPDYLKEYRTNTPSKKFNV